MTLPATLEDRRFPHLTEMQEAFVTNYVANGGNGKAAALAAGYSKSGAAVEASRMLRKAPIVQALMEETATAMSTDAVKARGVVSTLMSSGKSEYVRLEAAKDVLTRVGLTAPAKVNVSGQVTINIEV